MDTTVATSPDTASRDPRVFRLFSRPVVAWAFYDFANTIFSFA
ncbi:MAG: hypothetical protein JWM25_826, partial [Thermoleophilia bacterium]|nr:hypothetical protein [Thermoleophilia bacterium]